MMVMMYRPPMACQRASLPVPMPRSSGGSRAISATSTTTPYPASRPRIRPAPVSASPSPVIGGVSRHHNALTPATPAAMMASTRPGGARQPAARAG